MTHAEEYLIAELEVAATIALTTVRRARTKRWPGSDLQAGINDAYIGLLRLMAVLKHNQFGKRKILKVDL